MASFPPPNYVDPPNRNGLIAGIEIPLAVLMTTAVAGRFYSRGILRHILGWDDWILLLAWACALTVTVNTVYACIELGVARHSWDVRPDVLPKALEINLGFEVLCPLGITLTKTSICLTYIHLFPLQSFNDYFCKGAISYSIAWGIATIITQVEQYYACPLDPANEANVDRTCINQKAMLIATGALNSASDLAIFLWPARFLWGMNLPRDQRLGLIGLFCVGVVICVAGIVRMWYITVWFKSVDSYWDAAWNYIMLAMETNIGVFCACLPCCKPLLMKIWPQRFRSDSPQPPEDDGHVKPHDRPRRRNSLWGTTSTEVESRSHGMSQGTSANRDGDTTILMESLAAIGNDHASQSGHHTDRELEDPELALEG